MAHPVLVIENFDQEGTDIRWRDMLEAMVACERIRRLGRFVGFCSLSIRPSNMARRTRAEVQGYQFTRVALGRHDRLDGATEDLVEAFCQDLARQEVLEALPGLPAGQVVVLEAGVSPEVRSLDPTPYLPLLNA